MAWVRLKGESLLAGVGRQRLYTFDLAGRLLEAVVDGVGYRRGLDGRVLEKAPLPAPRGLTRRRRRLLAPAEAARLVEQAYAVLRQALRRCPGALPPELARRLSSVGPETLAADAAAFRRIWEPVAILPPDQYLSVVVQLTVGCWYGRCTFCSFYGGRPYRVRSLAEFAGHVQAAKAFFGPGLARRCGVFLGDANALALPTRRLLPYLEVVARAFGTDGLLQLHGLHAFLDAFSGRRRRERAWRQLAGWGLRRVYIGLESGSDALLRFLDKPGGSEDALVTVRALHGAGVNVGVILMVGAGGDRFAEEHVRESVRVVNAMELGPGDMLYLSPFVEPPQGPYAERARAAGVRPLTAAEQAAQAAALLEGIRLGRGARWSFYHVEEFLY